MQIPLAWWVSPFGHLRINVCCQLPGAFRRLPRPSSPLTAKASTVCAYSLDHICKNTSFKVTTRSHSTTHLLLSSTNIPTALTQCAGSPARTIVWPTDVVSDASTLLTHVFKQLMRSGLAAHPFGETSIHPTLFPRRETVWDKRIFVHFGILLLSNS